MFWAFQKPASPVHFLNQLSIFHVMCLNVTELGGGFSKIAIELIVFFDFDVKWDCKGQKTLKHAMDHFGLVQLVERPTRITNYSQTKIDLLSTNRPE